MGCHFLLQGIFPNPGIEPTSPVLAGGFFTTEAPGQIPVSVLSSLNSEDVDMRVERDKEKSFDLLFETALPPRAGRRRFPQHQDYLLTTI